MKTGYVEFRRKLEQTFSSIEHRNSIAYQLVDLTDLFQKISAIYRFARKHKDTALHNPIIFQIFESALHYGVCVQVRRLANGKQNNEVSLFKLTSEIRSNCENWSREDFVTWDGAPYDPAEMRAEHKKEEDRALADMMKRGETATWLPVGKHESIYRRHAIFDLLSSSPSNKRSKSDVWSKRVPNYLLGMLKTSASEIVRFVNEHLAHRVHLPTGRRPAFNVSLEEIEKSIISLWACYNCLDSIFNQNYMTPDITHSLGMFEGLELPVVEPRDEAELIQFYEAVKARMEEATNKHSYDWQSSILTKSELAV